MLTLYKQLLHCFLSVIHIHTLYTELPVTAEESTSIDWTESTDISQTIEYQV